MDVPLCIFAANTCGLLHEDCVVTPGRRRGSEYLDTPNIAPSLRQRSHRDIALANRMFGGDLALRHTIASLGSTLADNFSVLDVGAGTGGTLQLIRRVCQPMGKHPVTFACDISPSLSQGLKRAAHHAVCGSIRELPFANASVDLVITSLLLHHFESRELHALLAELNRVSKRRVVVFDLRRSWLAAGGLWLASFPLGFHSVSRHDGVTSVLRGFTVRELRQLVVESVGIEPTVTKHLGFRLVCSWSPNTEPSGLPSSHVPSAIVAP